MEKNHLAKLFFEKAKRKPNREILFFKDASLAKWVGITWSELAECTKAMAKAILEFGIKEQQTVGICSGNKTNNIIVDFANYANRAVSVPMYSTSSAEQMAYIVNDAKITVLFVGEQQQYDNAIKAAESCPTLEHIIAFDPTVELMGHPLGKRYDDVIQRGRQSTQDEEIERRQNAAKFDDLAVVMYTSGTTGEPKGVMLPHSALFECLRIHSERFPEINKSDTSLAFLPLSHIFERGWTYFCLHKSIKVYICPNPTQIQQVLKEVRPTLLCNVPRFWEKIATGVQEKIESFSASKKGMVMWALSVGKEYNIDRRRVGKHASLGLWFRYNIASKLIFAKLKKVIGIENGKVFPVGGAALDAKLAVFFRSMGIPIFHGYGLTETTATVTCYPHVGYEIGTVGTAMPDVEIKIGEDDEILVKGNIVFSGYYNKPEATAAAFTDGWFRTGDAGKLVDGHVVMLERIKDLFKTSNGKYIAPQQIETKLGADRYIEQIAVIGDKRNYVTAIIAPNIDAVKEHAASINLEYNDINELFDHPEIIKLYEERIRLGQEEMASFEQIKKFRFIRKGFSMEAGELTATLKLRRAVVYHNYRHLIDEMYDDGINLFM